MKYIKICLALILAMCIAIAPVSTLAATGTVDNKVATQEENADMLKKLGIIEKDIPASATITRETLAVTIANILDIAYFKSMCADVTESDAAFSKINAIVNLQIMTNDENGNFNPGAAVTYKDVANAFAKALCLEILYEGRKTETFIRGIENELIVGVKYQDLAQGDKFVKMVIEALKLGTITLDGVDEDGFLLDRYTSETLLYKYRKIYIAEGIVEANGISAVQSADGIGDGKVRIDGNVYLSGDTDIENALGYRVFAFVDEKAGNKVLCYVKEKNNILEIDAKDISSTENCKVTYRSESGKKKSITLDRYIGTLYNGVYGGSPTADFLDISSGKLILIDNNRDGKYDVVAALEYEDYLVSDIDLQNKIIYDKLGKAPLSYDPADNNLSITVTGEKLSVEQLEEYVSAGDILTVAKSNNTSGKKTLTIAVSYNRYIGVYRGYRASSREMTINSYKYKITEALIESGTLDTIEDRAQVRIYVNAFDEICYIEGVEIDTSVETYGYLMKAGVYGTLSGQIQFKIFSLSGLVEYYDGAKSIKVNNVKKTPEEVYDILTANGIEAQLIVYSLNEEGQISSIKVAKDTPDDNAFSMDLEINNAYVNSYMNNVFIATDIESRYAPFYPEATTSYVEVSPGTGANILYIYGRDDDGYAEEKKMEWRASLPNESTQPKTYMYDINDTGVAAVTIVENSVEIELAWHSYQYANFRVVEGISIKSDDEGDYISLSVWERGAMVEHKIREEIVMTQCPVTDDPLTNGVDADYVTTDLSEIFTLIQEGDIIQLAAKEGEIIKFRRAFTFGERAAGGLCTDLGDAKTLYAPEGFLEKTVYSESGENVATPTTTALYGRLTAKDLSRSFFKVASVDGSGNEISRVRQFGTGVYQMVLLDISDGEVTVTPGVTMNDAIAGAEAGMEVVLHSRQGHAYDLILIKR